MRKLITVAAAVALVTGLAACSGTTTTGTPVPVSRTVVYHVASSTGREAPSTGTELSTAAVTVSTMTGLQSATIMLPMDKPIAEQVPQGANAVMAATLKGTGWIDCWMEVIDTETDAVLTTVTRQRASGTMPQVSCATFVQ